MASRAWMLVAGVLMAACNDFDGMDPSAPARGPGQLVGNDEPVSDGAFEGGDDALPRAREVEPPAEGVAIDCDSDCKAYCEELGLENPVNAGVCEILWGVGLSPRPLEPLEACRRLYADFVGRFPTYRDVRRVCDVDSWGDTVKRLMATEEYVLVQQRKWADRLLYNNRAVNFERAFDMDDLVRKTFRGQVSWDQFAAVVSAHPLMVRRHDTPGDRAAFLFELFLGRPPYEHERSDIARLYRLWSNGYWEHPYVGRVPDAFIQFACLDENGNPDPETVGECTSVLWGHHELTLQPDPKRLEKDGEQAGMMWAGFLLPQEWEALQLPGRLVAESPEFWEHTVDQALEQLLGYNLAIEAPAVREALIRYLLAHGGDIRALHYAIATSAIYLQSSRGQTATTRRWTYGPLKQIEVEGWIESIRHTTGFDLGGCDHRLPHPEDYTGRQAEEEGISRWGRAMVERTRWWLDGGGEVRTEYRNLARTLGGCPSNEVGGRFTTVSVLNTAVQEAFISEVCGLGDAPGAGLDQLLPEGTPGDRALDDAQAEAVLRHQQRRFLGRNPSEEEVEEARAAAAECSPAPCTVEGFARPLCFALLSSSEMLFY